MAARIGNADIKFHLSIVLLCFCLKNSRIILKYPQIVIGSLLGERPFSRTVSQILHYFRDSSAEKMWIGQLQIHCCIPERNSSASRMRVLPRKGLPFLQSEQIVGIKQAAQRHVIMVVVKLVSAQTGLERSAELPNARQVSGSPIHKQIVVPDNAVRYARCPDTGTSM